jgi:hypothetical protein
MSRITHQLFLGLGQTHEHEIVKRRLSNLKKNASERHGEFDFGLTEHALTLSVRSMSRQILAPANLRQKGSGLETHEKMHGNGRTSASLSPKLHPRDRILSPRLLPPSSLPVAMKQWT